MAADKFNLGELAFSLEIDISDISQFDVVIKNVDKTRDSFEKLDKVVKNWGKNTGVDLPALGKLGKVKDFQTELADKQAGRMERVMKAFPFLNRFYSAIGAGGGLLIGLTSAIAYLAHTFKGGAAANSLKDAIGQIEDAMKSALTLPVAGKVRDEINSLVSTTKDLVKEVQGGVLPGGSLDILTKSKGLVDFGFTTIQAEMLQRSIEGALDADKRARESLRAEEEGYLRTHGRNPIDQLLVNAEFLNYVLENSGPVLRDSLIDGANGFAAVMNGLISRVRNEAQSGRHPGFSEGDSSAEFFGPLLPSGKYFTRTSAFRPNLLSMGGDDLSYKRMRG